MPPNLESDTPLVSVLMTAYNREQYIGEAIESVLNSAYSNYELIVVDDCSTDKTLAIARKYESQDTRIKVYANETNLGDYPNRNKAASYAKGKYLKYLDSDDMLYPHGLQVMVSGMEKYPEAALGLASRSIQQESAFPIFFSSEEAYRNHFFKFGFLDCGPTGVIIKTTVFRSMGGFSGTRMIGDYELWLRITAQYPVIVLPPALVFWRVHEGQEFFAGVKNGLYLQMLLPMVVEAISSTNCKLDPAEKRKIIISNINNSVSGVLQFVKKGKFKPAILIARKLNLHVPDFLRYFLNR
jgi:cellulose synthase/poly-beta-1,6-N-acetylglucosamine synthase-like glycosyltransferase